MGEDGEAPKSRPIDYFEAVKVLGEKKVRDAINILKLRGEDREALTGAGVKDGIVGAVVGPFPPELGTKEEYGIMFGRGESEVAPDETSVTHWVSTKQLKEGLKGKS